MRRRLPRNVVVLSWVSFFQDAASEMLYPIMPLFLTTVLGAPIAAVGFIEGLAEGTSSFVKIASGRLADTRRRRPMVSAGYAISSVAKTAIVIAGSWPVVLVLRFSDRVGKGLRTSPRDALLADATTPTERGRAFGFHRSLDTAGAVLGPLIGLGFYELLDHQLRPLFLIAFIPAIVSIALIRLVREPGYRPHHSHEHSAIHTSGWWVTLKTLPHPYRRVVTLLGIFSVINFSDALLLLRAKELGLSISGVVIVYCLYNAVYASLAFPAGIVSDRLPPRAVIAVGFLFFAFAYVGLGIADSAIWVWVLIPSYGIFPALTDGVARAWVANLLPPERIGTGIGLYHGVMGVGALLASTWAGLAWGSNGQVPLLIAGTVAGIIALTLSFAGRSLGL